jgi:hypothetical protein
MHNMALKPTRFRGRLSSTLGLTSHKATSLTNINQETRMRFIFNRGIWEDSNSLPEWQDNEDFSDYLMRIGYSTVKSIFGHEHGSQIEIYESSDGRSFYASVCPSGNSVYDVLLPDFPSLMMFIREYATAFSSESSNFSQQEILNLLEKFFHLYHGHPARSICPKCDPVGWEESVRAREERRKKQKTSS